MILTYAQTNSINLKSIQLNPDPPVAGKNLKVTLQGTSPQDISSPIDFNFPF